MVCMLQLSFWLISVLVLTKAGITGVRLAMSEFCDRNDDHASCPSGMMRSGGDSLCSFRMSAMRYFHSCPSLSPLQFRFSMSSLMLFSPLFFSSCRMSDRVVYIFLVSGLYEVITRILLASRAKAALACDNAMTHTVRTSSPLLMCLVIPLMMGYPRIFSACRRIVLSSLFCKIGFSM